MQTLNSQEPAPYVVDDDQIIDQALSILRKRLNNQAVFGNPKTVKDYLTLRASGLDREVFSVMFLDVQHRHIATEDLFFGTINACSVYPREVVKRALSLNASAVILSHNHPSGNPDPSYSDQSLTKSLISALKLVDVRVIDHIVTASGHCVSFAETGLL